MRDVFFEGGVRWAERGRWIVGFLGCEMGVLGV